MFVVAAAFLVFDLDAKFYPTKQPVANYVESQQMIIAESASTLIVEPAESITSNIVPKKEITQARVEPKSRLFELEGKQFLLSLEGDAKIGISSVTKKASLALKIIPIKGTNLQQFQVSDARFFVDNSGISITATGAEIAGNKMSIVFVSNNVGAFVVEATLDQPILDDTNNKQSVVIEEQNFYLIKKETPYKLNLSGTLSS